LLFSCSTGDGDQQLPPGVVEGSPTVAVGTPGVSPATSPTSASAGACANEAAIAGDPARQIGTTSSADVDGDGLQDRIRLAMDPAGPPGCAAFVVAALANGSVVAAPVWEIGPQGGLSQPDVLGVADIDGDSGREILVNEAAGASTQFVGAFVFLDGDLARVTVTGGFASEVPGAADLFAYGGSVGHIEAVDCTAEGIVVSSAVPSDETAAGGEITYEVERRFFRFDGSVAERADVSVHTVTADELDRFREFGSAPFGTC